MPRNVLLPEREVGDLGIEAGFCIYCRALGLEIFWFIFTIFGKRVGY